MTFHLSLPELTHICQQQIQSLFSHYLSSVASLELKKALDYALSTGGKRLRPLLIYAAGASVSALPENLVIPACAVEMIHTYSLIHDDLPAMDNADLRRNQPTCHKVFGDGMAILTGDALHTLAIQILSEHPGLSLPCENRLRMIQILTQACGPYGMAAGQALDIQLMNQNKLPKDLIENIYHLKTGALLTACLELGWLAAPIADEQDGVALKKFGEYIGLAFQIQDDILDIEASTEMLGKTQGIDQQNHKNTYPHLFGIAFAKKKVQELYESALSTLNYFGHRAQLLRELAQIMLQREK